MAFEEYKELTPLPPAKPVAKIHYPRGTQVLSIRVRPETSAWLRERARREQRGLGETLDRLIEAQQTAVPIVQKPVDQS